MATTTAQCPVSLVSLSALERGWHKTQQSIRRWQTWPPKGTASQSKHSKSKWKRETCAKSLPPQQIQPLESPEPPPPKSAGPRSLEAAHSEAEPPPPEILSMPSVHHEFFSNVILSVFKARTATVQEASAQAADIIDATCPPLDEGNDESTQLVSGYVWQLWTTLLGMACRLPDDTDSRQQDIIVGVIVELRMRQKGVLHTWSGSSYLWNDLPLFQQRITDTGGSPASVGRDAPSDDAIRYWRNQNGFLARCLEAGIAGWDNYALLVLRSALEGEEQWSAAHLRCEIHAATEWLIHSGPTLYRWAKQNDDDIAIGEYDCSEELPAGPLFKGRAGLSVERWNFWKRRLEELLQQQHGLQEPQKSKEPQNKKDRDCTAIILDEVKETTTCAVGQRDTVKAVVLSADVCATMTHALKGMDAAEGN